MGSLVLAGVVLGAAPTFASDSLQAGVTIPADQPQPVITENGTGYTPGTYAVGVVRLTYTYIGTTFPVGPFAAFNLNVGVYNTGKGQATSYPVALALTD